MLCREFHSGTSKAKWAQHVHPLCDLMNTLYFQITSELKRLAKGYSDFVKLIEVGKSFEKRELWAIQVRNVLTANFAFLVKVVG